MRSVEMLTVERIMVEHLEKGMAGAIREVREIEVGRHYRLYSDGISLEIRAKAGPYLDSNEEWRVVVLLSDQRVVMLNLADAGVVPYRSGLWNAAAYLISML